MGVARLHPGESVDALEEAIDIIRGIWAANQRTPLHTKGSHHHVSGVERGPAPAHTIPIWVGGGKPRMLDLIGRLADGWVIPGGAAGLADLATTNRAVDTAAIGAGRDPREIRRIANVTGRFTQRSGGFLEGPAEQWVEQLLPHVLHDGVGTVILGSDDPETIEAFAGDVVPALREAVARERRTVGTMVRTVPSTFVRVQRHVGIDYDDLPASLAAGAVEPGDAAYARTRSNYLRGGSPGLVLRPGTTAEVAEAITWARTQPVPLGIRSGATASAAAPPTTAGSSSTSAASVPSTSSTSPPGASGSSRAPVGERSQSRSPPMAGPSARETPGEWVWVGSRRREASASSAGSTASPSTTCAPWTWSSPTDP